MTIESRMSTVASWHEPSRIPTGVPLFDFHKYNRSLELDVAEAIRRVLASGQFIGGPELERFEQRFAKFCGVRHAVGVGNGTDAIVLALRSLGIGPGDEVITTSYSFVATAQAIMRVGADPRFVDIEDDGFNLNPEQFECKWSSRTRAILIVHLFGRPVEMEAVLSFARRRGLPIVEDAAQAHGARYRGQRVGSLGAMGCFSFYPTKNLGAMGDGGAVVTDDANLADRVRSLANHDRRRPGDFGPLGTNSRLDEVQAAVLNVKLPELEARNARRRELVHRYLQILHGLPVTLPGDGDEVESAPHVFAIRVNPAIRDALVRHLFDAGIETRIYYPRPIPRMSGFAHLLSVGEDFPNADRASAETLALPFHPDLDETTLFHIACAIRRFFEENRP